jgi:malic enzyme
MRSRLSPLIVRRVGPFAAALPFEPSPAIAPEQAAAWLEDAKLFATGWAAGLVVFGTFFS